MIERIKIMLPKCMLENFIHLIRVYLKKMLRNMNIKTLRNGLLCRSIGIVILKKIKKDLLGIELW